MLNKNNDEHSDIKTYALQIKNMKNYHTSNIVQKSFVIISNNYSKNVITFSKILLLNFNSETLIFYAFDYKMRNKK